MRIFTGILFSMLATSSVSAADPGQVFSTILGELGRQIEREQLRQQHRRLRPLWNACAGGDIAACDRAARFPNLNHQGRAQIQRMREAAELRPAYERNFYACQKFDRAACRTALTYPYLTDTDRVNLQKWQRAAEHRHDALTTFRRNQQNCYAGSLSACTAAIAERHLDASAFPGLERQRARLQAAADRRQARERQRQSVLAALRRDSHACHGGSIAACTRAITNAHINAHARRDLEHQRKQLRHYERLEKACVVGDRAACKQAVAHPKAPADEIALLKQRDHELAPFAERVVNVFTGASPTEKQLDGGATGATLLSLVALFGAGFGAVYLIRRRPRAAPTSSAPNDSGASPAAQPAEPAVVAPFPLTGHLPSDVRRVLADANP